MTDIILSMLQALNIDPDTHIRHTVEEVGKSDESHLKANTMIFSKHLEPEKKKNLMVIMIQKDHT